VRFAVTQTNLGTAVDVADDQKFQASFRESELGFWTGAFQSNFQAALDSTGLALDTFAIFLVDRADSTGDLVLTSFSLRPEAIETATSCHAYSVPGLLGSGWFGAPQQDALRDERVDQNENLETKIFGVECREVGL
jgi:hypothetical protein